MRKKSIQKPRFNINSFNLLRFFKLEKFQKPFIIALAIAIIIFANILISPFSFRLDASNGQAYTLSSASKKIIKSLHDDVQITFFVSSDIPTRLIPLKNDILALLDEYKREGSKVKVTIVDPKKDPKAATEAQNFGIQPLQFSQLEQDKYAVSTAYFGIGIVRGTNRTSIPQVTDIGSLEYNITSAIYKLTRTDVPKIDFAATDELAAQDTYQTLKSILNKQFTVESTPIATDEAGINRSYKALIVTDNNAKEYTTEEINNLKKYIQSGGNVLIFADGVWVNTQADFQNAVSEAKHNLFGLTKDFGITINRDLVLSTASEVVNFGGSTGGSFLTQYPFWIRAQNFNPKSTYFNNISQLTYPWVSSLTFNTVKDVKLSELVRSSSQSWVQTTNISIDPQTIPQPKQSDLKEFIVTAEAVHVKGGRLLVVSSSRFAQDGFLSNVSDNIGFIVNVLNDYVSGGILSGIQTRSVNIYPLPDLPASQKDLFKYLNILLLPGLFGIYGAWRLLRRK